MTYSLQQDQQDTQQPFHAFSEEELFSALGSSPRGLTPEQAQAGLARYGHNDISRIRKSPLIFQFIGHFKICS